MKTFIHKLFNLLVYFKWTDCWHPYEAWEPDGWADWVCGECGARM
jgi:hypothetical protein